MRKRRANERCSANSNVHTTNLTTRAQMTTGFNVRDPVTTNIVHYQSAISATELRQQKTVLIVITVRANVDLG